MRTEYQALLDWAVNRASSGQNLDEWLASVKVHTLAEAQAYDEREDLVDEDTPATIIPDGGYFIFPDGCAWQYRKFRNGKCVGGAEQSDMGTHAAARDQYADLDPDAATEVSLEISQAIVRELEGDDADPEQFVVCEKK